MSGEDPAAPAVDRARLKAFLGRVIEDFGGTMATLMCSLGDRLGLFQALAELGPATSAELAARAGVDERYTREWLACLAAAGYLTYDPASARFSLPPEHAAVLADRSSPLFLGGSYEWLFGVAGVFDQIAEGFRTGRGVPAAAYPGEVWSGMERLSARNVEHRLVQDWIPAVPGLRERLEEGAEVADVGCGGGHVLIRLARAFPRSRFTGVDAFAPAVARATANAEAAGVADRVRFVQRDAAEGLPGRYDLITTFDVVHDATRPLALLRAIREALAPAGVYLCQETDTSGALEEDLGPKGAWRYGVSLLYCLSVSRGEGGPGLGACGLAEPRLRALCAEAGLSQVRRLDVDVPFGALYEIRP